ncbi:hypothetical protein [Kitasatospora sp. P5_F3]
MQNDIWAALSEQTRAEVDELVGLGRNVWAIKVIRDAFEPPKPGIHAAVDVLNDRYLALGTAPFTPSPPLDLDRLYGTVRTLPTRPDAIEAVWDGDTTGWFVVLLAVTADPRTEHELGMIRLGTDLRLFDGPPPAWPEATEADTIGRALAERLGLPFHFTSPDHPDDTAPRWWDTR